MKKLTLATAIFAALTGSAFAADEVSKPTQGGGGTINFKGQIVDSPCTLSAESVDQNVSLGAISITALNAGTSTQITPFTIKLQDCEADTKKKASITFRGDLTNGSDKYLALQNTKAKGAAIKLTTASGNDITLNEAVSLGDITQSEHEMKFGAQVVKTATGANAVVAGDFTATAAFTMTYQ
ncbi:fimbrial protein [Aeromonas salmonicida]|uniref:fimbrial protein n=1 Tax=Aeromonas salmonicida TaxID=645 RepID=UPI003CFD55DA